MPKNVNINWIKKFDNKNEAERVCEELQKKDSSSVYYVAKTLRETEIDEGVDKYNKYTPGPWRMDIACGKPGKSLNYFWIFAKDICIAETHGDRYFEGEMANARLIVAAPDLLEACENALAFVEELKCNGIGDWSGEAALRNAINKAREGGGEHES